MKIFIETHSACRNQHGNGDEAEKKCPDVFVIFVALWLNLCHNNDQTCVFNALTLTRSLGGC